MEMTINKSSRTLQTMNSSSVSTATTSSPSPRPKAFRLLLPPRSFYSGRTLLLLFLSVCAGVFGWATYYLISTSETKLADTHFDEAAESALLFARDVAQSKKTTVAQQATLFAHLFPKAEQWPFVAMPGYEASLELNKKEVTGSGFNPIVYREKIPEFEQFARQYYLENGWESYVQAKEDLIGTFGVQSFNMTSRQAYHDTTGETAWGSPYQYVTPLFQGHVVLDNAAFAMRNLHTNPVTGRLMDLLLSKQQQHKQREQDHDVEEEEDRSVVGDSVFTSSAVFPWLVNGPAATVIHSICPRNNPGKIVGFVTSGIYWADTLKNAFAADVSGVDCVLDSGSNSFTFAIQKGVVYYKGEGDLHDPTYKDKLHSISLVDAGEDVHEVSAFYFLRIYPSSEFYADQTSNAALATAGVVCAIVLTSLLLVTYDCCVRKVINQKSEILEAKRQFMRFISHEVRTPLNSVCMGLKVMEEELEKMFSATTTPDATCEEESKESPGSHYAPSEVMHLSDQIQKSATSAVDILSDLLNYDKIESGTLTLERTIIPIFSLLGRILEEFQLPAQSKNIQVKLDLCKTIQDGSSSDVECGDSCSISNPNDLPTKVLERRVVGDMIRITQILRNLVSNALKFTPNDGSVTVKVAWLTENEKNKVRFEEFELNNIPDRVSFVRSGELEIRVIDSGAGMSTEQLKRLFGQGVQFNASQLQCGKGSGLGLFIAKGLVEQHGGVLTADSAGLGLGTTFTLRLPLFHVPDDSLPDGLKHMKVGQTALDASRQNKLKDDGGTSGGLSVLIVDDSMMNRKLLARLLSNRGHTCEQAQDGAEAAELVERTMDEGRHIDTILMDYEMPVMNGPTSAKRIRSLGCDSLIVGITGNILARDIAHFKECGASRVIGKPVDIQILETLWIECGLMGNSIKAPL